MEIRLTNRGADYSVTAEPTRDSWRLSLQGEETRATVCRHEGTITVAVDAGPSTRLFSVPYYADDAGGIELFYLGRVYRFDVTALDTRFHGRPTTGLAHPRNTHDTNVPQLGSSDDKPIRPLTVAETGMPPADIASEVGSVLAPMVGTVAELHVRVGDRVEVGTPIATISAMKVYVSVPAAVAGHVTEVYVDTGALVVHGQPIARIETDDASEKPGG